MAHEKESDEEEYGEVESSMGGIVVLPPFKSDEVHNEGTECDEYDKVHDEGKCAEYDDGECETMRSSDRLTASSHKDSKAGQKETVSPVKISNDKMFRIIIINVLFNKKRPISMNPWLIPNVLSLNFDTISFKLFIKYINKLIAGSYGQFIIKLTKETYPLSKEIKEEINFESKVLKNRGWELSLFFNAFILGELDKIEFNEEIDELSLFFLKGLKYYFIKYRQEGGSGYSFPDIKTEMCPYDNFSTEIPDGISQYIRSLLSSDITYLLLRTESVRIIAMTDAIFNVLSLAYTKSELCDMWKENLIKSSDILDYIKYMYDYQGIKFDFIERFEELVHNLKNK